MGGRCVNIDTLKAVFYRLVHGGALLQRSTSRSRKFEAAPLSELSRQRQSAAGRPRKRRLTELSARRLLSSSGPAGVRGSGRRSTASCRTPGCEQRPPKPPRSVKRPPPGSAARRAAAPRPPNGSQRPPTVPNGPAPRPPVPAAGCAASPARTSGPRPTGGRHRPPAAQPRPAVMAAPDGAGLRGG